MTIFTIILAREKGESELGTFSIVLAAALVLRQISELGYSLSIPREIGEGKEVNKEYISEISKAKNIILLLIFPPGLVLIYSTSGDIFGIMMILYILPLQASTTFRSILRGIRQMQHIAKVEIIITVFQTALSIFIVYYYYDLKYIYFLFFASELIKSIWYKKIMNKLQSSIIEMKDIYSIPKAFFYSKVHRSSFKKKLKDQLSVLKVSIYSTIRHKLPILTMGWFFSSVFVGIYSAGNRIINFFRLIPGALLNFLIPELSNKKEKDMTRFFMINLLAAFFFGTIGTLVTFYFAEEIIIMIFTEKFKESASVLKVLSFLILTQLVIHVLESYLIVIKKEKLINSSINITTLIMFAGVIILGKLYGAFGAALAVVIGDVIMLKSLTAFALLKSTTLLHVRRK